MTAQAGGVQLREAYLEVIPTATVLARLECLPRGAHVGISCSPKAGVDPTLDLVDSITRAYPDRGFQVVPHIAARCVRDRSHLKSIVSRLDGAGVSSVFVPGGDRATPIGQYSSSLELLRDLADLGHRFEDVGIAAHPEGHALVGRKELLDLLLEKQGLATYLVTQMCFDAAIISAWLLEIRRAGVALPAWLGLPGVVELPKLLALSLRIGVGQSVRVLKNQKGLLRRLMTGGAYRPDRLLADLGGCLADPELNIPGFHLYSFNHVKETEAWRTGMISRLEAGHGPEQATQAIEAVRP